MRAAILSMVFASLFVTGCGPAGSPGEPDSGIPAAADENAEQPAAVPAATTAERVPEAAELVGAWLLEDLGGRGVMDMVQTTISFDVEGRAFGSGGCNRFTGSFTFTDGQVVFGPLAGTKMMCPEAVMDQEDRFHQALGDVEQVAVDGPFLLIYVAGSEKPLRFTRMEPDLID